MHRFLRAAAIGALLATSLPVAAAPRPRATLDRALWHSADRAPVDDLVDVIITTEANGFAALRARLLQHGDRIVDEQPQLSVLTAVLHAGDLRVLESDLSIRHLSANAIV